MVTESTSEALQNIGLSREEANVYELLISTGFSTVGTISRLTNYSRTKIYSIFDKLLFKGWIKLISDKPRTYIPVDPHKIVSNKKESMISAFETISKELSPIYTSSKLSISEIFTYHGYDVSKKVEDMIFNAKNEIDIITAFLPRELIGKIMMILTNLESKGILIRSIASDKLKNDPVIKNFKDKFELKIREIPFAGLLIIDDTEVLFGSIEGKDKVMANLSGIWTKNKELIHFFKLIFNQLYEGESLG